MGAEDFAILHAFNTNVQLQHNSQFNKMFNVLQIELC